MRSYSPEYSLGYGGGDDPELVRHIVEIHLTPHAKGMGRTLWAGSRTPCPLEGLKEKAERTHYSFLAQPNDHHAPRHSTNYDKLFFKTKVGI